MAYATPADFAMRFGADAARQLSDTGTPRLGAVNVAVLQTALDDASAEIDARLVGRMSLPLADPPDVLRVYCCDIARWRLMHGTHDERVEMAYKSALAFLGRVAAGDVLLQSPADTPAQAGVGAIAFELGSKAFGRDDDDRSGRTFWGC